MGGGGEMDFVCYELSPNKNKVKSREKVSNFLFVIYFFDSNYVSNQCWAGITIS